MGPCGDVRGVAVQATLAWEEKGSGPRAQRGPVAGATTKFSACPIDRRLRLCARVGTQHLFVVARRRSCVLSGAWSSAALLPAAVLCERARCAWRAGWRARARCCCVAVTAAAAACALRLARRRRARVAWRVRVRRLRGACAGRHGGVGLASCRRCGRGVVSLCGRSACGSPVPVLEMSLMPPQAVGAVAMAVSPWCVVRVHGVVGCPRGTAARGAVAVLAWRWR